MRKKYGFYPGDEEETEKEEEDDETFMARLRHVFESWRQMVNSGLDSDSVSGFIDNSSYVDDRAQKRRYSRWIVA